MVKEILLIIMVKNDPLKFFFSEVVLSLVLGSCSTKGTNTTLSRSGVALVTMVPKQPSSQQGLQVRLGEFIFAQVQAERLFSGTCWVKSRLFFTFKENGKR